MIYSIRVVVEDKESSGGTFSIKVSPTSTIERLQQEVTQLNFCGDHEKKRSSQRISLILVLYKKEGDYKNQLRLVQRFLWRNIIIITLVM